MQAQSQQVFAVFTPIVGGTARASTGSRPGAVKARLPGVVCVHLDNFFAAAEQAVNPALRGQPVLVCAETVLSASCEAQMLGAKPGMSLVEGLARCPQATVLRGQPARYAQLAERIGALLSEYSVHVDATPDGFLLEWDATDLLFSRYQARLREIQMHILAQTGLSVSIGAGRTRIVAMLGALLEAPRSLHITLEGMEFAFISSLPVSMLPGLSSAQKRTLLERGILTIGHLRRVPRPALEAAFGGDVGNRLWRHARGLDESLNRKHSNADEGTREIVREMVLEAGCDARPDGKGFLEDLLRYLSERLALAASFHGTCIEGFALRAESFHGFAVRTERRVHLPAGDTCALFSAATELFSEFSNTCQPLRALRLSAIVRKNSSARDVVPAAEWHEARAAV
jgi:DNA polymerase-4